MNNGKKRRISLGLVGYGAFGQLIAEHLHKHFSLFCYDPRYAISKTEEPGWVEFSSLSKVASCPVVVLATPVATISEIVALISPFLRKGSLVLDVGSVKMLPTEVMARDLPGHVNIVGTHPLFGPQSARDGIEGLKIAVCSIRGERSREVEHFLRNVLKLDVISCTPEEHDAEAATVQGLTHLIAKVLLQMEPLPTTMTTKSFDLISQAINMVRDDAPEVFDAIERLNPFVPDVRRKFFGLAAELDRKLNRA